MKTKYITLLAILLFGFTAANAQGEGLFKQKCNTCHMVDKGSTGPLLKGVKAKWNDAGEGPMLYEWVKNSQALIQSGKSKLAKEIEGFSPTAMPPQQVTDAEVDQILDYIDSYVPPTPTVDTPGAPVEVKLVPDYKGNLNIFYALFGLMIVLLLAIILMTNSILTFIRSDLFKTKMHAKDETKGGNLGSALLIVGLLGSLLLPNASYALSTPDLTDPAQVEYPWLLVENSDLYILLGVNIILLIIVMYLKGLFNDFYYMVYEHRKKTVKAKQSKVTKVLTDAVPIEEEASILMDHEYDGIRELDNNLPPWWVYGFYLTIFFSVFYIAYYHVFNPDDLQEGEYNKSMVQAKKDIDAYLKEAAMNVDETNVTLLVDEAGVSAGKSLFETNCTTCHKSGEGDIGPNLTDNFWLYGNDIKDVFKTIKMGTANGMPEHASKLNPVQLQQVSSYVLSMKFKPGKEPQGKEYPKK
jgi:cytochrome c oxidase cbb3-type subunit 3